MASNLLAGFYELLKKAYNYFFDKVEPLRPPPNAIEDAYTKYDLSNINSRSSVFVLPDGRKIGYGTFGSLEKDAKVVLYMHGLPGSRTEAVAMDRKGKELNARIIGLERPGYGWTSPCPGWTILSWTKDVGALADHLELKGYGVMGISGGGPYALACAHELPADKLKAVTIICGLGPPEIQTKGMNPFHWAGFKFGYKYFGWFVRWYFSRDAMGRLDLTEQERLDMWYREAGKSVRFQHPKDVEMFEKHADRMVLGLVTSKQSYAQGFRQVSYDGTLLSSDFGFRVENIRKDLPFFLWYGKLDHFVPPANGEYIKAVLPEQTKLELKEDETHGSICFNWQDQALEELVSAL